MSACMKSNAGVGVASILLIVVVLCMTVFASLSLLTAKNDAGLTDKTVNAAVDYYEADARAQQKIADVCDALASGVALPEGTAQENGEITFSQPVSETMNICVRLNESGEVLKYGLCRTEDDTDSVTLELWK